MVRRFGSLVIALLWGISISISIFHLVVHDAPLHPTILGQWSLLGASLVFGGVGYQMSQKSDTPREQNIVVAYTLGIFCLAGLASGGYATHQYLSPVAGLPIEGVVFQALFVALIGGTIGMFIGRDVVRRDRSNKQLTALNNLHEIVQGINQELAVQTTREDIERTVCEGLAESDSYEFAWIGVVDDQTGEVTPSTAANTQGYLDDVTITVDDSDIGHGPTGEVFRTGEPQIVHDVHTDPSYSPWRAKAAERGISCSAAIPITYEEHFYGVLNIYTEREHAFDGDEQEVIIQLGEIVGLAIGAVKYEKAREHEHERLEFLNRIIRHNLLNGLNLINARTDLLQSRFADDADAREHLETIETRITDMTSVINTMRTFMDATLSGADHETRPVRLRDELNEKVVLARDSYEDAVFETHDLPDESTRVIADELVGEVFENVISNAVVHNDKDTPVVEIWTTETTRKVAADEETGDPLPTPDADHLSGDTVRKERDAIAVHIADNGPGIPDAEKEAVLQKGVSDLSEPGNGFGLYLVKEMMNAYGGIVKIRDNPRGEDGEGAVFDLVFLRESS